MRKNLLFCLILLLLSSRLFALEVYNKKDKKFDINIDLNLETCYLLHSGIWAMSAPAFSLEFQGELSPTMGFEISLDFSELFGNDYEKILESAFFYIDITDVLTLRAGQFKTPFGQDYNLGSKTRPYPFHSLSSKQIAPGLDRGLSLAGDKLWGIMGFEIGVFNGQGTALQAPDLNSVLAAGNISARFVFSETMQLEFGYAAFFSAADYSVVSEFDFGQGGYLQYQQAFSADTSLFVLAEYLEKRIFSEALNDDYDWVFGLFAAAGLRYKVTEVFSTFELYKARAGVNTSGDEWILTAGFNFFLHADFIRLSVYYKGESWYNTETFENSIIAETRLKF